MRKRIDLNVEALRGYCAIIVVFHHCLYNASTLNPNYAIRSLIGGFVLPGHVMVLIFFMLSGYVIGLTYLRKDNFDVLTYLRKRIVRLYPIYLFATLLTILLFKEKLRSILGTLTFTQNIFSDNLIHNGPLWSLNHEFIYYLLAIPILKFKPKIKYVIAGIICLLVFSLSYKAFPIIIEGYLVGFIFWLTGFSLSSIKLKQSNGGNLKTNTLLSLLLLLISTDVINLFPDLFSRFGLHHSASIYNLDWLVQFSDFAFFIYCFYAIIIAASIKTRFIIPLTIVTYLCSWGQIILWFFNGMLAKSHFFYIPLFFLVLSTLLLFLKKPLLRSFSYLEYLGSISYGTYVVHFPILFAIGSISFFSGSLSAFIIRCGLLLIITMGTSYFLEKLVQPKISKFFNKNPT